MTSEELLFEGILHDFRIDNSKKVQPTRRSLNDYYFDVMEKFNLDSLLVGKVLNDAQDVIIFGAVTRAGESMDIHYHGGKVQRITDFTAEMLKWRTAFLHADKLRNELHDELFNGANQRNPGDDRELKRVSNNDEDYKIASKNLIQSYTG